MDVTYKTSDWDKAKQQVGGLIGLGVWGKGMIDDLKDITKDLEKASSDIKKYDVDGAITFHHTSQEDKYTSLFEDFKELHGYTKEVGTIVDDVIDQRFYEDMDAFVESMRDLHIGDYKTDNRIGATQIIQDYHAPNGGYEFEKGEVSLEDLFDGDNFYADQIKLEYEEVLKAMDESEEDFTFADYQQVALDTHAFEYNSIKDQQLNKEFWVSIAALAVIITATIIFPPAGLTLGAIYGTYELTNAVRGKDLISGRELGTGERWFRGLLAPLDIVPGLGAAKKFVTTGKVTSKVADFSKIGLKSADFAKVRQSIGNTVQTAKTKGLERIGQIKEVGKSAVIAAGKKIEKDVIDVGKVIDKGATAAKQMKSDLSPQHVTPEGLIMRETAENTHAVENIFRGQMENVKGVFGSGGTKGAGNVKNLDDVPKIKEIEVNFKRNVKHDSEEFARQLKDQEKGMNELTVNEYLKNRDRYIAEGRAIEGNTAQKMARQEALKDKIAELRKQGLSRTDATKQASDWLETKAALHNPDQIAGGRADIIGGLGDKRVNSSIGSQWKYRIDDVDEQIMEIARTMSPEQLNNTYLNVRLTQ